MFFRCVFHVFFLCFFLMNKFFNRTKGLIGPPASSGLLRPLFSQVCLQSMTWETYRKPIRQVVQEHPDYDGWCTSIPGISFCWAVIKCRASRAWGYLQYLKSWGYPRYHHPIKTMTRDLIHLWWSGNLHESPILGNLHVGKLYETYTYIYNVGFGVTGVTYFHRKSGEFRFERYYLMPLWHMASIWVWEFWTPPNLPKIGWRPIDTEIANFQVSNIF